MPRRLNRYVRCVMALSVWFGLMPLSAVHNARATTINQSSTGLTHEHSAGKYVESTVKLSRAGIPSDAGPFPENYAAAAKEYVLGKLQDPSSLQDITVAPPEKSRCIAGYGPFGMYVFWHGWRVAVTYSFRGSDPKEGGSKTLFLWFNGNAITRESESSGNCLS